MSLRYTKEDPFVVQSSRDMAQAELLAIELQRPIYIVTCGKIRVMMPDGAFREQGQ